MANEKILVVDDDANICELLRLYLTKEGYQVTVANDGEEGLEKFNAVKPDMVLLDVMMPRMDGLEVCRRIRKAGNTPVMMLTAKGETFDKVLGLELGADDYVTKPFNPLELVARVKSQLRRYTRLGSAIPVENAHIYETGGLSINDDLKEVRVDGDVVKLTPIEYNILFLLMKNQGRVFSINQIYENIWNEEAVAADNTVAVHIRHIREKIEINPREPRYLKVVWGLGYKVEKI